MTHKKVKQKRTVLFIYLSIVVHFYLFLMGSIIVDTNIVDFLLNRNKDLLLNRETIIQNIMVKTVTATEVPEEGLISDKPNLASSPEIAETDEELVYNYLNPDMQPEANPVESTAEGDNQTPADETLPEDSQIQAEERDLPETENDPILELPKAGGGAVLSEVSGDFHTSYYDPDMKPEVKMNSEGDISLPTIPAEFAEYFEDMGEKIKENWYTFFPVFQYYLNLLKDGEISVYIQLDKDGNVVDTEILESFDYDVVDQSLINAINYSENFGPIPENLPEAFRYDLPLEDRAQGDIGIIFIYNLILEDEEESDSA